MNTRTLIAAAFLALSFTLAPVDAEAGRRLGGGKSMGMQKQVNTDKSPSAAPAQVPNSANAAAAPGSAAAQAQPRRSWMGPLAGLAAGLGLAALASHFGFGEAMGSMLMVGLLVMAAMALLGMFLRRKTAAQSSGMADAAGMRYAPAGVEGQSGIRQAPPQAFERAMPGASGSGAAPVPAPSIPADFDVAGFVRNAKVHFIRLQAANDAGNLEDIREFTTPEMFAELKMDITERGDVRQTTDVMQIDADVVEFAEDASRYVVSVRFSGLLREDADAAPAPIEEIWHLVKPRSGKGGWLLGGIQQLQ